MGVKAGMLSVCTSHSLEHTHTDTYVYTHTHVIPYRWQVWCERAEVKVSHCFFPPFGFF